MPYVIFSVLKLTMDGIKLSLTSMPRIAFQSVAVSLSSSQTDSNANLTTAGGLAMERTSAKCFFLMALTAKVIKCLQEIHSFLNGGQKQIKSGVKI